MGLGVLVSQVLYWFPWIGAAEFPEQTTFGTARFAKTDELKPLTGPQGLLIGRTLGKRPALLRYDGPAHLLTIAPTRSGKGVGTIIPNLLSADRSVLVVDPKGENARIAARARGKFGKTFILDPFGIAGPSSAAFNPLAALEPDAPDLLDDAASLAEAIVYDPPAQVADAHWNEEARALFIGLTLFCVCHEHANARTLATIRNYLSLGPQKFAGLIDLMIESDKAAGLVSRAGHRFNGKSEKEAASVLSTLQRHTNFLDSPRIQNVTSRSDFAFGDLKRGIVSVFLVLPPDRMDAYARWLRLMVGQAIQDIAREPAKPAKPVLFLLDEFAAMGRLPAIERAFGLMAGYGMQLWPILQCKIARNNDPVRGSFRVQ